MFLNEVKGFFVGDVLALLEHEDFADFIGVGHNCAGNVENIVIVVVLVVVFNEIKWLAGRSVLAQIELVHDAFILALRNNAERIVDVGHDFVIDGAS